MAFGPGCMGTQGSPRSRPILNPDGPAWARMGPAWARMGPAWARMGPAQIRMGPHGPAWAQHGPAWGRMGPDGPGSRMGSVWPPIKKRPQQRSASNHGSEGPKKTAYHFAAYRLRENIRSRSMLSRCAIILRHVHQWQKQVYKLLVNPLSSLSAVHSRNISLTLAHCAASLLLPLIAPRDSAHCLALASHPCLVCRES